ncbi:hypothetical protein BDN70DRAFT_992427 [Pholiota conissans]|uniref:Uncharacterized protein n=1 Tax=Pholiota conissans TaxID=109636 RepID=A0A9P6CVK0_9AGAR|nr:hypothetical protein BDN70DRAFT_992427 [Pholiota conissans]
MPSKDATSSTWAQNVEERCQTSNTTNDSIIHLKMATGECPPYNNFARFVSDPFDKKIYMIRGTKNYKDCINWPTSDFYACDTSSMTWTNLTNHLKHLNPSESADFFYEREIKPLPCVSLSGATLLRIENSSYIALFGGCNEAAKATSELIIVDPKNRQWWTAKFKGEVRVSPRINPAVVAIGDRIYIFGGHRKFDVWDQQPCHSYSVAQCLSKVNWQWLTCDHPYPDWVQLPPGQCFKWACALYDDTKILLTPYRHADEEAIDFTPENCFFFHIEHKSFETATTNIIGAFPRDIRWHLLYRPPIPVSKFDSTVIMCCFIDVPGTDDIAPEIWKFSSTPEQKIECLGIMRKMWDLDSDFRGAFCIDDKVRIMGSNQEGREVRWKWNTYLDINWKK